MQATFAVEILVCPLPGRGERVREVLSLIRPRYFPGSPGFPFTAVLMRNNEAVVVT